MGFSLFPRNDKFFDLFSNCASNIRAAADSFLEMVENYSDVEAKANRIKDLESKGDNLTHQIIDHLNASFITPIDREDILALAGNLDNVLDEIEGVANRMLLFNVDRPTKECIDLVRIVARAAVMIEKAVANLRQFKGLKEYLIEINSLENQADEITRRMTARLFQDGNGHNGNGNGNGNGHNGNGHNGNGNGHDGNGNVLNLIKWKEIYARLEHTADRMEDVANVIEDICVKNT